MNSASIPFQFVRAYKNNDFRYLFIFFFRFYFQGPTNRISISIVFIYKNFF